MLFSRKWPERGCFDSQFFVRPDVADGALVTVLYSLLRSFDPLVSLNYSHELLTTVEHTEININILRMLLIIIPR